MSGELDAKERVASNRATKLSAYQKAIIGYCPNCDVALSLVDRRATLYCSEFCREMAKHIRWIRKKVRSLEDMSDPSICEAIKTRIQSLLGSGYPVKDRYVPRATRQTILEQDNYQCVLCGAIESLTIDHVVEDGSLTERLRTLCNTCNSRAAYTVQRPASTIDKLLLAELIVRIDSPEAVRQCDREDWDSEWRSYQINRVDQLIGSFTRKSLHTGILPAGFCISCGADERHDISCLNCGRGILVCEGCSGCGSNLDVSSSSIDLEPGLCLACHTRYGDTRLVNKLGVCMRCLVRDAGRSFEN